MGKTTLGAALVLILLICGPLIAGAQVTWNPQVGMVVTHYSDEPDNLDIDQGVGFQLGTYARLRVTDNVFLQPGLFIQRTSADFAGELNGNTAEDDIKTTSLKVPVYLGFYLGKAGPFRLRSAAGVSGKYLTGVKDNAFDLDGDQLKNLNWSLNIGAGVDLMLLTLDIEYDLGLSPVFESNSDSKLRLLVVSAGLKF